jgi:solute carrier family 45 protein 1/2/4
MISLLMLSWSREIVGGIGNILGADPQATNTIFATQIFAVAFVYVLDFAINVIQAAIRAFIVDCAPTHQQEDANAWASRLTGVGNIVGYLSGYLNLPAYLPFLGDTQFKILSEIASIIMGTTVLISCFFVKEADPRILGTPTEQPGGVIAFFKGLYQSIRRLPPQIRAVCTVQLFAWIAWFPFLFYTTTYVAGIYSEPFFRENPNRTDEDINQIMEDGTRIGTFALLIFAFTTFASSVLLPFVIKPSYAPIEESQPSTTPMTRINGSSSEEDGYFKSHGQGNRSFFRRMWSRMGNMSLQIPGLTLRRAWLISHLVFTLLMGLTFAVRNSTSAIILIGLIGIPWSMTNWAPFALISAEMSKRDAIRRGKRAPPPTREGQLLAKNEDEAEDQAGVVLGIHNVAIAAPQVVATLVSSVIFKYLQKPRGTPGDDSVAWVLRFGGLCALGAAWATTRVQEGDADEPKESDE